MKVTDTAIPDVKIIEPIIFEDERGYFFESFNQSKFEESIGRKVNFVQDNQSKSYQGTVRGLHYQLQPHAQGKIIRVLQGQILDVALDIRKSSPNFGKCVCEILSYENKKQLWIPEGFAHGFLVISETAEISYKVTNYYTPTHQRCIDWNDPAIGIGHVSEQKQIRSLKDAQCPKLEESELFK